MPGWRADGAVFSGIWETESLAGGERPAAPWWWRRRGFWVFGKQRKPDRGGTASRVGLAVRLVQKLRETESLTLRPGAGPVSQVAGV